MEKALNFSQDLWTHTFDHYQLTPALIATWFINDLVDFLPPQLLETLAHIASTISCFGLRY